MNQSRSLGWVFLATSLLLMESAAHAQRTQGSFERTLDVGPGLELEVLSGAGSITVHAGASGRAEISGRIDVRRSWWRGDGDVEDVIAEFEANPPIELDGNRLRVGQDWQRDWNRNANHVTISYDIVVPADTRVSSHTGSGTQVLSGVSGPLEARTGSGTVRLEDIDGDVVVSAGSGSIRAEGIAGSIEAKTGSGAIRVVQSAPGDVQISTGSGSSELRGIVGALDARAGSGSITVDGRPQGPWNLETGSGSVRLRLPSDAGFEVDARAGSGGVSVSQPITLEGGVERGRVNGEVNGGGPLVHVRTGSGSIRFE